MGVEIKIEHLTKSIGKQHIWGDVTLGIPRRSQREPGAWCRDNGVTPPPGSFASSNVGLSAGA